EEHSIDDAEYRGTRANPECQNEKSCHGESRSSSQPAKDELQVGRHRLEDGHLPDLPTLRFHKSHVSECAQSCLPRFVPGEILEPHELLRLLFDMSTQFFGQFVVDMAAAEDSLEPDHSWKSPSKNLRRASWGREPSGCLPACDRNSRSPAPDGLNPLG